MRRGWSDLRIRRPEPRARGRQRAARGKCDLARMRGSKYSKTWLGVLRLLASQRGLIVTDLRYKDQNAVRKRPGWYHRNRKMVKCSVGTVKLPLPPRQCGGSPDGLAIRECRYFASTKARPKGVMLAMVATAGMIVGYRERPAEQVANATPDAAPAGLLAAVCPLGSRYFVRPKHAWAYSTG